MTKILYQQKIRKPMGNTKTPPKTSITHRLRTDLGRSVRVTTAIQLVWLNRFTGTHPPHYPQKPRDRKHTFKNLKGFIIYTLI